MKLQVRLTRWDVVRSNLIYTLVLKRSIWWIILIFSLVSCVQVFIGESANQTPLVVRVFTSVCLFFFVGLVMFSMVVVVTTVAILMKRLKGILGEHVFEASDAGLTESTEYNTTLHSWKGLGIHESKNYAFILVGDTQFHYLPKGSASQSEEVSQFLYEVRAQLTSQIIPPLPTDTAKSNES